jgi:uncharacterized protein YdcH (DUF465 family)
MKESLAISVDPVREIEEEHRLLAERLRILTRRAYLTPSEQQEAQQLKRKKLSAKDRLFELTRTNRGS